MKSKRHAFGVDANLSLARHQRNIAATDAPFWHTKKGSDKQSLKLIRRNMLLKHPE